MAGRTNPFRNIRFIVRPGPRKLKILFTALILACAVALVALGMVRGRILQQTQAALDQAATLEQENQDLRDRISILGTVESVKQIANEILGLVDKDTVIFETDSATE